MVKIRGPFCVQVRSRIMAGYNLDHPSTYHIFGCHHCFYTLIVSLLVQEVY